MGARAPGRNPPQHVVERQHGWVAISTPTEGSVGRARSRWRVETAFRRGPCMLLPPFMLAKRMRHKIDRIESEIRGGGGHHFSSYTMMF